jgi:hypothetical protein
VYCNSAFAAMSCRTLSGLGGFYFIIRLIWQRVIFRALIKSAQSRDSVVGT